APTAVSACIRRFPNDQSKSFMVYDGYAFSDPAAFVRAELGLSLDVLYHLVEQDVFERYLSHLFGAASRYVVIYATDADLEIRGARHVKHRRFTGWVSKNTSWTMVDTVPRSAPEFEDFFVFAPT